MCVIVKWDEVCSKKLCLIHRILLLLISLRAIVLIIYVATIAIARHWYQYQTSEAPNMKKAIIAGTCLYSFCEVVFSIIAYDAEKRRSPKRFSAWIVYLRCQFGLQVLLTIVAAYILFHLENVSWTRIFFVVLFTTLNWIILYHAWVIAEHLRGRIKCPTLYMSFKKPSHDSETGDPSSVILGGHE